MIYAVTVSVDLQTIDPTLPARLMGRPGFALGAARRIPGGVLVFQSALINEVPGEASVYRFVLQFGSVHDAAKVGNWLYAVLYGSAAALSVSGRLIPIDHHTIIQTLQQVA